MLLLGAFGIASAMIGGCSGEADDDASDALSEERPRAWVEVPPGHEIQASPTGYCVTNADTLRACHDYESLLFGASRFLTGVGPDDRLAIRFEPSAHTVVIERGFDASSIEEDTLSGPPWIFRGPSEPGYHEWVACAEWDRGGGCWVFGIKTVDPENPDRVP